MSNNHQRPWRYILIPVVAAIIGGFFVLYAALPQTPTTPVFSGTSGEIDTDGSYEISWESSKRAIKYILVEDRDPSFTSPRTVYTGSETKKHILGKSDGDYYYRVRAYTDAGESEWSPIRKITVIIATPLAPTPKPTSAPTPIPTPTPIPIPTPTTTATIDTMDTTLGWRTYRDDTGSSIHIESIPGRTDNAIEITYDLEEWGWVVISKRIDPEILSEKEGIRFFYKGSGTPNTIELKLVYGDVGGTTFGVLWNRATVTDDWLSFEVPYSRFYCWWPEDNCLEYGNELDLNRVKKIEFAISNKPEDGDASGSGIVIIDDVHGIMSPSPTPTPTITPTPSPTPPPPIILSYHDFDLNDVCTLEDNYCGWANTPGKAVIYGSMTKSDIHVPEGASELEVTISIGCNGYGEGLLGQPGSAACIRVDSEVREERIDSTMNFHHGNYYKYEGCDTFSNTFNVKGKEEITLIIEMSGGARLDFKDAGLTFS